MGFSGGNFPDAPSQIVVGFSKADDVAAARKLSDAVVGALSERWRVRGTARGDERCFPAERLRQVTVCRPLGDRRR